MEYLLECKMPLTAKQYDILENAGLDYTIEYEGLVFEIEEERETAVKLLNNE